MNAADSLTAALAEIVTRTGCTFEAAFDSYFGAMISERPDMAAKTIRAMAQKMGS